LVAGFLVRRIGIRHVTSDMAHFFGEHANGFDFRVEFKGFVSLKVAFRQWWGYPFFKGFGNFDQEKSTKKIFCHDEAYCLSVIENVIISGILC
jgi:hypothetical protein